MHRLLSRAILSLSCFLIAVTVSAHVVIIPEIPVDSDSTVITTGTLPVPDVELLEVDTDQLFSRAYRRVEGNQQILDAGGNAIQSLIGDYNFVTAGQSRNGITQITRDAWVSSEALVSDVRVSTFSGILLPETPLLYPVAWILRDVRPSASAGGDELENIDYVKRYTMIYIYETVVVDGKNWYRVGDSLWVHQYDVARVLPAERHADIVTEKWVSVDLYEQVMIAYENDTPVFATLISSGLPQYSTGEGTFTVYQRMERHHLTGNSSQQGFYYIQDVPWLMFFDGEIGFHGAYWHNGFGYRQSHGCVNLSLTDAEWLFNWTMDEYDAETGADFDVFVYSSGEYD